MAGNGRGRFFMILPQNGVAKYIVLPAGPQGFSIRLSTAPPHFTPKRNPGAMKRQADGWHFVNRHLLIGLPIRPALRVIV